MRPVLRPALLRPLLRTPLTPLRPRFLSTPPPKPTETPSPATPEAPKRRKPAPLPNPLAPKPPPKIPAAVEYDHEIKSESDIRKSRPPHLIRPIGLHNPPQPGENSGVDNRSWSQRREDFVDYDKHLERRQQMANEMAKPYFRDFSRLSKQFKGKSWIAPSLLFRVDKALHFPNLQGRTLENMGEVRDTTKVLFGKVSIVSVYSSQWAENQTKSFFEGANGGLEAETTGAGVLQRVDVNVEQNWMTAALVRLFSGGLKKRFKESRWGRYFLLQRGLTEDIKHEMGYWNHKVGYVYLVDWNCRIRWAGCGVAEPEEREALRRGSMKLVEDFKKVERAMEVNRLEGERVKEEEAWKKLEAEEKAKEDREAAEKKNRIKRVQ